MPKYARTGQCARHQDSAIEPVPAGWLPLMCVPRLAITFADNTEIARRVVIMRHARTWCHPKWRNLFPESVMMVQSIMLYVLVAAL